MILRACTAILILFAAAANGAGAAEREVKDFYGHYVGKTISQNDRGLSERDLKVTIEEAKKGFSIAWSTGIPKPGGKVSRKTYKIKFHKSKRKNIYAAARSAELLGNWIPLDPMKGEPYVWARILGDTLTVFALQVTDDGGYEMQVYDRTLTKEGLEVRWSRRRPGQKLEVISAELLRVEK